MAVNKPQKSYDDYNDYVHSTNPSVQKRRYITLPSLLFILAVIAAVIGLLVLLFRTMSDKQKYPVYQRDLGYYQYKDTTFYNQGGSWYQYDEGLGWILADPSDDFLDHYDEYYEGRTNTADSDLPDFSSSEYYDPQAGISYEQSSGERMWDNDADADKALDGGFEDTDW